MQAVPVMDLPWWAIKREQFLVHEHFVAISKRPVKTCPGVCTDGRRVKVSVKLACVVEPRVVNNEDDRASH